ncbi:MAG: carboxypeptidase-like regulatory domain-containing protein [Edaphobacter sp.]
MTITSLLRFGVLSLACWACWPCWASNSALNSASVSALGSQSSKTQPVYTITGTLVSSVGGAPIAHGHLSPTLVTRSRSGGRRFPAPAAEFDTDEHGRFAIVLPSAGAWRLTASARGFTRQDYLEHEQFSSAVVLSREAPAQELRFVLSPEANITGAVLDEAGEPVRRAQVSLVAMRPAGLDSEQPTATMRASSTTDDRGMYEFAGLRPGNYRICVQAQPWYAVAAGSSHAFSSQAAGAGSAPAPDPGLDVTYPLTWFPGVDDQDLAETLSLRAGDSRQADFHLLPIPSIHLLINPPAGSSAMPIGRRMPMIPLIQRIGLGAGVQPFASVSFQRNAAGQIDVGGLAPGLYQVRVGSPGQDTHSSVVRISSGSGQTLDLDEASDEARIALHVDGLPEAEARSVEVNLLDPETHRSVLPDRFAMRGNVRLQRRGGGGDRVLEVPSGTYEVVLQGRPELYLMGVSAKGAEARGRIVTVPSGDSSLTLHVAGGSSAVTGIASFGGKPSVGAMVLLVPATFGDPAAITVLRRDQSNTDGSFDLQDVIPGQYILVAIDSGWLVNWNDASTLHRYLMQGVPVDLTSGGDVKQNIVAQAP